MDWVQRSDNLCRARAVGGPVRAAGWNPRPRLLGSQVQACRCRATAWEKATGAPKERQKTMMMVVVVVMALALAMVQRHRHRHRQRHRPTSRGQRDMEGTSGHVGALWGRGCTAACRLGRG
jgi:hypothetical protein